MSAWMLQDELYNDLGATMEAFLWRKSNTCDFFYDFSGAFHEKYGGDTVAEVVEKMHAQNANSYNYRYDNRYASDLNNNYKYKSGAGNVLSIPQFLKHLSCWDYQSCETPEHMTMEIFKQVKEFRRDLCESLIKSSAEWQAAGWGENKKKEEELMDIK